MLFRSDLRERLATDGADPAPTTPEEFRAHIGREIGRWAGVLKAAGLRPE